jgi:hypothetical protein
MSNQQSLTSKLLSLASVGLIGCALMTPKSANATIHEIVAAFCSGGGVGVISADGHLEAPGVSDPTRKNFARPVVATGSTIILSANPLIIVISDGHAAKYPPGTTVIDLATFKFLLASLSDSEATHCKNFANLP